MLVGAVVDVLVEKLISGALMKFAGYEGIDSQLNKWKDTLMLIQDVLADVDQQQFSRKAVQSWLNDLQDLAYDIDDILDDMNTEAMKRELNQESEVSTSGGSKLLKWVTTGGFTHTPYNMMYRHKMSSKLDEISTKLDDLFDRKKKLGLDVNLKVETSLNKKNKRPEETSLVDVSTVLGREVDLEVLLSKLLGDEPCNLNVSVMSIVGLGGIGKTTLARLLYNNQNVKDHFQLRAWFCVSDDLDVFAVSKAIYQAVSGENKEFANLDLLHVALKKELSTKKFLIVLDDVWSEDQEKWNVLEKPLKGAPGSKIMVTTRKTKVASVMNSSQPYSLGVLSDEHALSLFAKSALNEDNFDKHPSLLSVAQLIIEKCDGLPLALIAIGRVLKEKDDDEWEKLLNSEIWSLPDESNILPALKLSYYDLPLHLKQLFAYCSLFPKDYEFNKEELVLLWMAEGFLSHSKGSNRMESLGRQYFEELRSRSFFQPSTNNESEYTMHDLMNDLAISVAGEFFFMLDDNMDVNGRNEAFDKFRHFSFKDQRGAQYIKLKELRRSSRLRTFLSVSVGWTSSDELDHVLVELLTRLQFLRVLSLTRYCITMVPQSVGGLKHLRYLNFSGTSIKEVPEEVSELYNLQSLLVRVCTELSRLPVSFAKLTNLRHLDMSNTPKLKKTPLGIGRLTSIQTLSKVTIEDASGFKITELKDLVDLQGELSVKGLEKVTDPQEATDVNLERKKGLVSLDMEWSDVFDDSRNSLTEYEVFERLKPPPKLKKLNIMYYGGMEFPSWLGDPSFYKLTVLRLKGCRNCTHFNGISFSSLEYWSITDMEGLERCSNGDGENEKTNRSFPHLRELHIEKCPKLAEVSIGSREVYLVSCNSLKSYNCPDSVEKLDIIYCSSMTSLTLSTTLQELGVTRCEKLVSISMGEKEEVNVNVGSRSSSSMGTRSVLREVTLRNCDSLESYNSPHSVEKLDIGKCNSMTLLTFSATLQELDVRGCEKLVSISMGEKEEVNVNVNVGSRSSSSMGMGSILGKVYLENCDSLKSYNCPNTVEKLDIKCCSSMTSLTLSTTLQELEVWECNKLVSISMEKEEVNVNVGSRSSRNNMGSVLRQVSLLDCDSLESYNCHNSVEKLRIIVCNSMTSLTFSATLLHELPSALKSLVIIHCGNLKSFPHEQLQSFTSLEELVITGCESMDDSFPCGLWPPNLMHLGIGRLKKSMSEWGLQNYPPSLVDLTLYGGNNSGGVTSFAMEADANKTDSTSFLLPPSLTALSIGYFEEVESISEVVLRHLTHLKHLDIIGCSNIKDVPKSTLSLGVYVD